MISTRNIRCLPAASAVSPTGVSYQGYNNCDLGARPAMWIDLNADVLN